MREQTVVKSVSDSVLLRIVVAALACLAPPPWISFPAAALLVLWFPGQLLRKIFRWDSRCAGGGWIGLATSIVLIPLPLSWVWLFSNSRWAVWATVLAINLLLFVAARRGGAAVEEPPAMLSTPRRRTIFVALVTWIGVCVFGAIWLPQADSRMVTQAIVDYTKHHAVLYSLEHHPLPLHNIFYEAEKDTPYYYHQYHHLIAAALRKLAADRVSIPLAFGLTSAITAMAFLVVTFLLAREFYGPDGERAALLATACAGLIGGWDIVPVLIRMACGLNHTIILDSWCPIPWRLHNLMTQFMWCPQHVAATLAVTLAAFWLRRAPWSAGWIVMTPLLAASIFGSSVHMAMTVFVAAAIYVLLRVWAVRRDRSRLQPLALSVIAMILLGAALMGYQAWGYHQMSQRMPGGLTTEWPRFEYAFVGRLVSPGVPANFLDAPWLVLVDFGVVTLACLIVAGSFWSAAWRDAGLRLPLLAGIIGLLATYSIRSSFSPLDYGFRVAIMPGQVAGAICVGALLRPEWVRASLRGRWRYVLGAAIVLGLPSGFYEAPLMAARSLLQTLPEHADRNALCYLRDRTPQDAVIQGDPVLRPALPQLTDRQIGVMDPRNSHVRIFYPRDMAAMKRTMEKVKEAFSTNSPRQAHDLLRDVGVHYILTGTVEHKAHDPMPQFDDEAWFECVYRDGSAQVYRLAEPSGKPVAPASKPNEVSK